MKVANLFMDYPSCLLSLHRIATEGQKLSKRIGEWYGPTTVCNALRFDLDPLSLFICVLIRIFQISRPERGQEKANPFLHLRR